VFEAERDRLVQDDFLMARERPDGHVYFVGGLVAFPGISHLSPLLYVLNGS